jgi:hypothetical protein
MADLDPDLDRGEPVQPPDSARSHLEAAARALANSASDCTDALMASAMSTAQQAADTALLALAAVRADDEGERSSQLGETIASARATVLTCTMAIYRTGQPRCR